MKGFTLSFLSLFRFSIERSGTKGIASPPWAPPFDVYRSLLSANSTYFALDGLRARDEPFVSFLAARSAHGVSATRDPVDCCPGPSRLLPDRIGARNERVCHRFHAGDFRNGHLPRLLSIRGPCH